MSEKEKLALLGFIFFIMAFAVVDDLIGKLIWLFFSGIAAYQFVRPTQRAADDAYCSCYRSIFQENNPTRCGACGKPYRR